MIPTNRGLLTPEQIVGECTYINYATNRRTISAERLARIFGRAAPALEARYLQELREQPKGAA